VVKEKQPIDSQTAALLLGIGRVEAVTFVCWIAHDPIGY
jgi:hypothetical protein